MPVCRKHWVLQIDCAFMGFLRENLQSIKFSLQLYYERGVLAVGPLMH